MGLDLASEHALMSAVLMDVFCAEFKSLTGAREKDLPLPQLQKTPHRV